LQPKNAIQLEVSPVERPVTNDGNKTFDYNVVDSPELMLRFSPHPPMLELSGDIFCQSQVLFEESIECRL